LLTYREGLGEDLHDLASEWHRWLRRSRRARGQDKIADATSGEVGLVALLAESANDFGGVLFGFRHLNWFDIPV
jgi:hypothetical protein